MDREMYFNYAKAVNDKLREEVNGYVKYRIYFNIDAIIFTINFKDFDFEYAMNDIQDKIYNGDSESMAEEILKHYRNSIRRAFFKTDERKERDNRKVLEVAF